MINDYVEYVELYEVPVNGKILKPVIKMVKEIIHDDKEYTDIRVYKNRATLSHFLEGGYRYDIKEKVYNLKDNIAFIAPLDIEDYSEVDELKKIYSEEKVDTLIKNLLEGAFYEYNFRFENYRDNDFNECIYYMYRHHIEENKDDAEAFYILTSFVDFSHKDIYFDIYKTTIDMPEN